MPAAIDTAEVLHLLETDDPQLLEVLPASAFDAEHLPGAVNVALPELTEEAARAALDPSRPVVVYCYDTECDLSARGAALLAAYGFDAVYDYRGSKTEWLGLGHAVEGDTPASVRAGAIARTDVGRVGIDASVAEARAAQGGEGRPVVVVDEDEVVIGAVRPDTLGGADDAPVLEVLQPGPPTVRPSITAAELAQSMDDEGQDHVLVSTLDGKLVGLVLREDLDAR